MNSPLTTAVVGTSTPPPRPNAPLAPAMATTSATTPNPPAILRALLRDMPLHRHTLLEPRGHHNLVIAHRSQRHRARADPVAVDDAHGMVALLARDCIARHDDDVVLPLELDVDRRGE